MSLLVIGADGQLGRALAAAAPDIVALTRAEADLTKPATLAAALARVRPACVINAAGFTHVDAAEADIVAAYAANADGAGALAAATAAIGIPLVHVSTDYVFDGRKGAAYVEDDRAAPLNAYGASKRVGELAVADANPRHAIVRTSWVYAAHGRNFVRGMLRLAQQRDEIAVVEDEKGCPTAADDLANALIHIAHALARGEGEPGMFHYSGDGAVSRRAFAEAIFAEARALGGPFARVAATSAAAFGAAAQRPACSALSCAKIARVYGLRALPWRDGLARCLSTIAADGWRVS